MALIERNPDPSPRDLRLFGLLLGVFLGLLGASLWYRTGSPVAAAVAWGLALVVPVVYFAVPPLRRPLYAGWMSAVYPLGWLVSHALLAVIFYGVLTPVGLLMRLVRHDPMRRKPEPQNATYWRTIDLGNDRSRYFRQS